MILKPDENAYRALTAGAAVQVRDTAGVLALTGADRVDFLQRMTTNNMLLLRPGRSCVTVLTSPTAKTVQVFTVYPGSDALVLLPAPGETNALFRHLRGQIFFMDKVGIADRSASQFRLRVMGPTAGAVLAKIGVHVEGVEDGAVVENDNLVVVAQFAYDLPGFELVAPVEGASDFLEQLAGAGATILEDDGAYQAHRVELGRPVTGHELTSEYNPLEAGLGLGMCGKQGVVTPDRRSSPGNSPTTR
ncbi:MAG: hypothetical protein IPK16_11665 [Anaerolineales bacterium]|nr:hypothetical protein [Anaerolineales bacterium]